MLPATAASCHGVVWRDDRLSPPPNNSCGYHILNSWGGIRFPCPSYRSGKPKPRVDGWSVGAMAFSHRSAAEHSRGTPEMPSKSQSVVRGGEMLHTSLNHADVAFGMFWLEQALRYLGLGGREVGGGEGTKLPLHLHNFLGPPCVPAHHHTHQGHRLPAASGCLCHPQPATSTACS